MESRGRLVARRRRAPATSAQAASLPYQHSFVFVWKNFDEFRQHLLPVLQNPFAARTAGRIDVAGDEAAQSFDVLDGHGFQIDARMIAAAFGEVALLVKHVS